MKRRKVCFSSEEFLEEVEKILIKCVVECKFNKIHLIGEAGEIVCDRAHCFQGNCFKTCESLLNGKREFVELLERLIVSILKEEGR